MRKSETLVGGTLSLFLVTEKMIREMLKIGKKKVRRSRRRTVKGREINQRLENVVELVV